MRKGHGRATRLANTGGQGRSKMSIRGEDDTGEWRESWLVKRDPAIGGILGKRGRPGAVGSRRTRRSKCTNNASKLARGIRVTVVLPGVAKDEAHKTVLEEPQKRVSSRRTNAIQRCVRGKRQTSRQNG